MRILHLGDFHYKSKGSNYEQNLMIEKMSDSLKAMKPIDLIFFSGDLVHSGSIANDFKNAYNLLLDKLAVTLNINKDNIIISAGNHDVDRGACTRGIINYFDANITDNSLLNAEFQKKTTDYVASKKSSENYLNFLKKIDYPNQDQITELFSTHIRKIGEVRVGILTLNSAWLSSDIKNDFGRLLIPSCIVKDAVSYFKGENVSHKFILMHHPFSYFKEYNAIEIEDIINKEFNLKFSGHVHRESIETKYSGGNGIYTNTTQATLTFDRDSEIGYSIIEYNQNDFFDDDDDSEQFILVERGMYIRKEQSFRSLEPVKISVPCGIEKANQNKLRRKITEKYRPEINAANELLLDFEAGNPGFLDVYTAPTLNTKTIAESSIEDKDGVFNFETIYYSDDNYIFFGKDKCGKTSLLKNIQLHYIKNYSSIGKVPLYLDYKELETKFNKHLNIQSVLANYYSINFNDAEQIVSKGKLILLLDNLDTNSVINDDIIEFLGCNRQVRFIACSEYLASRVYFEELDHLEYTKIYFGDLTRTQIRQYTEKKSIIKDKTKNEDVLDRISNVCKQLQLPANYWTVSLILLIYKKSNDDYNKNLFGILDMCVDEILQKKQLLIAKNKLTFEQYKDMCSKLAYFLYSKHKNNVYSAEYIEIMNFLDNEIKKNSRLVANAKDIFEYFFAVGILKEKLGRYTFRLNGIFEYFLAYYINHHPEFKSELLQNDDMYLSFKNELELYSGFKRDDTEFVTGIFNKTKQIFDVYIKQYITSEGIDSTLVSKYDQSNEFKEFIKQIKLNSPLKHQIQDAVKDTIEPLATQSEVHLKKSISSTEVTTDVLETYLHILARVFKNSDNVSDNALVYDIFDYLLDAYIAFGFMLIDHASNHVKEESQQFVFDSDNDFEIGEKLLKIITNFIPILTEVLLYDGVGHISLKKIIEDRITQYRKDAKNNQYKLFILYFLLMDIDLKGQKELIENVFDEITLPALKVSTFTKLNFYLAFKAYKDKSLEQYIGNKIRIAQKRLNNKTDDDSITDYLKPKNKKNLVRKIID